MNSNIRYIGYLFFGILLGQLTSILFFSDKAATKEHAYWVLYAAKKNGSDTTTFGWKTITSASAMDKLTDVRLLQEHVAIEVSQEERVDVREVLVLNWKEIGE